jgi:hypothetical protein
VSCGQSLGFQVQLHPHSLTSFGSFPTWKASTEARQAWISSKMAVKVTVTTCRRAYKAHNENVVGMVCTDVPGHTYHYDSTALGHCETIYSNESHHSFQHSYM